MNTGTTYTNGLYNCLKALVLPELASAVYWGRELATNLQTYDLDQGIIVAGAVGVSAGVGILGLLITKEASGLEKQL